jgi:hypothetical protein
MLNLDLVPKFSTPCTCTAVRVLNLVCACTVLHVHVQGNYVRTNLRWIQMVYIQFRSNLWASMASMDSNVIYLVASSNHICGIRSAKVKVISGH